MDGRVVVVTGASSGIGAAAAVELARRGARIVAVGRDRARLDAVAERARAAGDGRAVVALQADFASLEQVRRLADELLTRCERIDVLVNNAGLVARRRTLTEDGNETTFQVNHLAAFLLTNLLRERLRASAPARVVTTSSDAHRSGLIDLDDLQGERSWSSWRAYCNSKLANVLFTRELAKRVAGDGITANCLHPGVVRTRFGRDALLLRLGWLVAGPFMASPRKGASTIVYLASAPEAAAVSGAYFTNSREVAVLGQAADDYVAEQLWQQSARLVGVAA